MIPVADLHATDIASSGALEFGQPITYTITHTNYGTGAADGSNIKTVLNAFDDLYDHTLTYTGLTITCTTTGGAQCPLSLGTSHVTSTNGSFGGDYMYMYQGYSLYDTSVPYWPA